MTTVCTKTPPPPQSPGKRKPNSKLINISGLVKISNGAAQTMVNYNALKTKVLAATPASTASSNYSPTNSPAVCPPVSSNWAVIGNALPPAPNKETCECMFSSLACVPKSGLSTTSYANIFNFVCGRPGKLCAGISGDPKTGVYGAYGMCTDTQKLGYVLNEYYKSLNSAASACSFEGQATTQKANAASSCSAVLASASAVNSVAATATSGPTSSPSSSNPAAGNFQRFALFTIGEYAIGAYLVLAMTVGAGMVLL
jgi:1,3-beta-glucanosyltransferase GAS1